MKKEIKTEIMINASREKIWEILTDFKSYPEWNPFIQSIAGELKLDGKLKAKIVPPGSKGMMFKPTIIALEKPSKFIWLGHFLFKGLFDGQHQFELFENEDGNTIFIQKEIFKGVLVPFLGKKLELNTKNGFNQMNQNLKKIAENG